MNYFDMVFEHEDTAGAISHPESTAGNIQNCLVPWVFTKSVFDCSSVCQVSILSNSEGDRACGKGRRSGAGVFPA